MKMELDDVMSIRSIVQGWEMLTSMNRQAQPLESQLRNLTFLSAVVAAVCPL